MNAEATMMPMTVRQVAEAVQGRLIVPQTGDGVEDGANALATSAVSDSRQVREGSVFVAIAGERVDGHDSSLAPVNPARSWRSYNMKWTRRWRR